MEFKSLNCLTGTNSQEVCSDNYFIHHRLKIRLKSIGTTKVYNVLPTLQIKLLIDELIRRYIIILEKLHIYFKIYSILVETNYCTELSYCFENYQSSITD